MVGQLKSSPLSEDSSGVFFPGEIEKSVETERLTDGIPIDQNLHLIAAFLLPDIFQISFWQSPGFRDAKYSFPQRVDRIQGEDRFVESGAP